MNRSTIPYYVVEERKRLNRCIENAPDECEKEIYRKVRDMKIPYDKLEEILEASKDIIKRKEKRRKSRSLLFCAAKIIVCIVIVCLICMGVVCKRRNI
ncbi:MAG: hypothetical protein Q4D16_14160 [Eubacteriales bacterium]|nr:hypothetical protein [Eubacteriales bacterium]